MQLHKETGLIFSKVVGLLSLGINSIKVVLKDPSIFSLVLVASTALLKSSYAKS